MEVGKEETFPLRLICIEQTIASQGGIWYCMCKDWGFHIISHTWTKDVRDWSIHIAGFLPAAASTPLHHAHKKVKLPASDLLLHDSYAELFKQHSFADKKGYAELIEFLCILAADGVDRVWFDALCINQADAKEKDREISHMGAYYACSAGCYVWSHGVGGGYQLWASVPPLGSYKLPRWFSRVWTLQEFVLPTELAFIVGMDKEGFTAYYAYKAFCCSTGKAWCLQELMDNSTKAKFGPLFELSTHLLNSRKYFPCPHCGSRSINDRGQGKASDSSREPTGCSSRHVYYLKRSAYLELMKKSRTKSIANGRLPGVFESEVRSRLLRLPSILVKSDKILEYGHEAIKAQACAEEMRCAENVVDIKGVQCNDDHLKALQAHGAADNEVMHTGHNDDQEGPGFQSSDSGNNSCDADNHQKRYLQLAALAIREISERFCSEGHDEDRLLSILGLLEIEGKVQLRTGKTLQEQTIEIAQGLLNYGSVDGCISAAISGPSMDRNDPQSVLVLLCLAQYKGNPTLSMSWAPTFSFQKVVGGFNLEKMSGCMFGSFKRVASIEGVSKVGLKLHCPFMQAKIVPFSHHNRACGMCEICRDYTRMIPNRMKHFVLEVDERKHYFVYMWVHFDVEEDANEVRFVTACPPTCSMAIKAETSIERLMTMSLDVWLLLLAQDKLEGCSQPYGLFLVCVGQDVENLHKVGVFFNGPGWDPEKDDSNFDTASELSISASSEPGEVIENEEEEVCKYEEENKIWRDKSPRKSILQDSSNDGNDDYDDDNDEEEGKEGEKSETAEAMDGQEEELEEDELSWQEDLEGMRRGNFNVSGFGQFLPLHLFTFHDQKECKVSHYS